ncbi:MAG TPA: xanthine dehydrogenase small subunit, partial [Hellea balneolensis]|nr:xanthine dehydrogenase small subunit [Hellea balneolensis]
AINACIVFMPTLDGKEIRTVESLGTPDAPHEIQDLVAKKNASQCGFCTPGIVMSLHALQLDDLPYTRNNIDEALAGNLCRCTGYGPIIDAAMSMHPTPSQTMDDIDILQNIQHDDVVEFSTRIYGHDRYFAIPKTVAQLTALVKDHPDAVLLAGGTDVGLWVTKHHKTLEKIIYLGNVNELNTFEETDENYIIGAGVKYTDACAQLGVLYPDMDSVMRRIGSTQIRNLGTIGGNIANGSPIGDMPPLLIAAGARLVLASQQGERDIALEDFFIDYGKQDLRAGEFVKTIIVPKIGPDQHYFAYKISKRFEQDISALCMGLSFDMVDGNCSNVRLAYGGMAATPKRATHAEKALEGQIWGETSARAAMAALDKDFTPITDMRASKDYRMNVAKNLILKAWLETKTQGHQQVLEAAYEF